MKTNKKLNIITASILSIPILMNYAYADISINSNHQYATQINEDKFKNIGDAQAKDELRWAIVVEALKHAGIVDVNFQNALTQLDNKSLNDGQNFQLYTTNGSLLNATVANEPIVHIGSGSKQETRLVPHPTIPGQQIAVSTIQNVNGINLNGNNYTFAGGTTKGEVVFGDIPAGDFRTLTGVAAGRINENSTDAINGSQLHATNQELAKVNQKADQNTTNITNLTNEVNKGLNFADDAGNTTNLQMGDTLKLSKADSNVTVDVDTANKKVNIGLADNINVQSVTSNTVTSNTVTANTVSTGSVSMSTTGINAGNLKITNVANGAVNATSKEAINGSQLHQTNQNVTRNETNITNLTAEVNKGLNFADDAGNKTNLQMGETLTLSKDDSNVTVDVDTVNKKVKIGLANNINVNSVNSNTVIANTVSTGGVSMSTTGINAGSLKISNVANGAVNATSKEAINGSQLYQTNQNVTRNTTNITNLTTEVNKGLNFADDAGNTTNLQMGDTLKLSKADSNVTVDVDTANKKVNIGLADNINVQSVTSNTVTSNTIAANTVSTGSVSMSTTGINAGNLKITNVADGAINATSKEAINGSQLFNALQNVDVGNVVKYDGTTQDSVTLKGINGTLITNLKDGAVNATSKDAVNGSQLHATNQELAKVNQKADQNTTNITNLTTEVNKGLNFSDDAGNTTNLQMGDTLKLSKADSNVTVDVDTANKKVNIGLADNINLQSVTTGGVSMSTTGINAGDLKITNVADGAINATSKEAINGSQLFNALQNVDVGNVVKYDGTTQDTVTLKGTNGTLITNLQDGAINATSKDAVNGSQLHATNVNVLNNTQTIAKGLTFTGDTGSHKVQLGDTFGIVGSSNIATNVQNGQAIIGLKNDITLNSVTSNTVTANTVSAKQFVAGDVSVTENGINAGNKTITNVAEGVNGTDAVNVNQLKKAISGFTDNSARINQVDNDAKAGIAAAMAVGTLGQAWTPGASTISISGSTYAGKMGWAIGGSNMTENGRWLIKYNVSGSSNNKFGGAGSITYQY